ncbi:MAG: isochorismatase family protein [Solirubrobacteraceae bacterium]|nr:isochorismatase family protein [Solirubrobacteraceae bacterium]
MSIAPIAPYALPCAADLPPRRVGWRVDPARAVLLVHDMQNYFVAAYPEGEAPLADVVPRIAGLAERCRALGVPVVYSAQPPDQDPRDRGLLTDFWGTGLGQDGAAHRIVDALAPADGDRVLTKWRYSAFQRTDLREMMRDLGRDQLIITGIYAHIGCLMTACEAFMRDVEAFFVADATADFSLEEHRMALRWAAGRCAVTTMAAQVLDALRAPDAAGGTGSTRDGDVWVPPPRAGPGAWRDRPTREPRPSPCR